MVPGCMDVSASLASLHISSLLCLLRTEVFSAEPRLDNVTQWYSTYTGAVLHGAAQVASSWHLPAPLELQACRKCRGASGERRELGRRSFQSDPLSVADVA